MTTSTLLVRSLAADYGLDVTTAQGARRHLHACERVGPHKIESERAYVRACRRLARWLGSPLGGTDARLLLVAWNHLSPRQWIQEGQLEAFLAYWEQVVERPETVGSPYNWISPAHAFEAWQARVPPSLLQRLGKRCATRIGRLLRPWYTLSHPLIRFRPLSGKRSRTLVRAARAIGRRSGVSLHGLPTKTLAALGRLSPELQRAALVGLPRNEQGGRLQNPCVRVRELNWAEVARVQQMIAQDPTGRARAAFAAGKRQWHLFQPILKTGPFCPAYPNLDPRICAPREAEAAVRLVRGESPQQIALSPWKTDHQGAVLTRQEAHQWLLDGAPVAMLEWWIERYVSVATLLNLRSWSVARWLARVAKRGQWEVLSHPRTERVQGQTVSYTYLDRIDEIQEEDLTAGEKTGVHLAFVNTRRRMGEAFFNEALKDHRVLATWPLGWQPFAHSMRLLNTKALLAQEGKEMRHCVGSYAGAVERKECVIFGIRVGSLRSTVEVDRRGYVRQHHGYENGAPPLLCVRVLERFLRRAGLGGGRSHG